MKKLTSLLLLICPLTVLGQAQSDSYFVNDLEMKSSRTEIKVTEKGDTIMVAYFDGNDFVNQSTRSDLRKYIGTPYYRNQWFPGTASVSKNDVSKGLLAFDVVNNQLRFAIDDKNASLEIEPYSFEIDGLTFKKLEKEVEKAGKFYYNILSDSDKDPLLVKQHTGTYFPLQDKTERAYETTKSKEYAGKFVKKENYFFIIGADMIAVSKKKSFFKALGTYGDKAQKLVTSNKLNLKNAQDIVKLGKLMNQ